MKLKGYGKKSIDDDLRRLGYGSGAKVPLPMLAQPAYVKWTVIGTFVIVFCMWAYQLFA
jgi:hypothetical protein